VGDRGEHVEEAKNYTTRKSDSQGGREHGGGNGPDQRIFGTGKTLGSVKRGSAWCEELSIPPLKRAKKRKGSFGVGGFLVVLV